MKQRALPALALACMFWPLAVMAQPARPVLAAIFADHAVLQRDRPIPVYGNAVPGAHVTVSLGIIQVKADANANGRWSVTLPAMPAGGPYVLTAAVEGSQSQTVRDVAVGDVFLCSGQSNMELPVRFAGFGQQEARAANDRDIRHVTVPEVGSPTALSDFPAPLQWQPATPQTAGRFSAVCYFFGRELKKHTGVTVGLINAPWPGTRLREWISEAGLRQAGIFNNDLDLLNLYRSDPAAAQQRWGLVWESWWKSHAGPGDQPWSENASGPWIAAPTGLGPWSDWPGEPSNPNGMSEPGVGFAGHMWLRTSVTLTAEQAKLPAVLSLGAMTTEDVTWVNGKFVGGSTGEREALHTVPAGTLRAGVNKIVTSIYCVWKNCGLAGNSDARALRFQGGGNVPLNPAWEYKLAPLQYGVAPQMPWGSVHGLVADYNGMIAPIGAYGLRAILWYQGESDVYYSGAYRTELSTLMADWRRLFGAEQPFLIVQLPAYGGTPTRPVHSGYAEVREAQRQAVEADRHAALVVTIDIGAKDNLHPPNKQEVGRRLALAARHLVYGEAIPPSGPRAATAALAGKSTMVSFKDVTGRLLAEGGAVTSIEVCRMGRTCAYAPARIVGNGLSVTGGRAGDHIRYCWGDAPVCTLADASGLPVGPFELTIH